MSCSNISKIWRVSVSTTYINISFMIIFYTPTMNFKWTFYLLNPLTDTRIIIFSSKDITLTSRCKCIIPKISSTIKETCYICVIALINWRSFFSNIRKKWVILRIMCWGSLVFSAGRGGELMSFSSIDVKRVLTSVFGRSVRT